jgi:hypothetical protein
MRVSGKDGTARRGMSGYQKTGTEPIHSEVTLGVGKKEKRITLETDTGHQLWCTDLPM